MNQIVRRSIAALTNPIRSYQRLIGGTARRIRSLHPSVRVTDRNGRGGGSVHDFGVSLRASVVRICPVACSGPLGELIGYGEDVG